MTRTLRRVGRITVLALALGILPHAATGQSGERYGRSAVSPHAHGTAVAVSVGFAVGSQHDRPGLEGSTWLLARVLEDQINQGLDPSEARVSAAVDRSATVFTLLALPSAVDAAWARVDSLLFDAALDAQLLLQHRDDILAQMTFEDGSPFRDFEAEAWGLLADPGSPFVRPVRGTRTSLQALDVRALEEHRATHFTREGAARAEVGPLPTDADAAPLAVDPPPPTDASGPAWQTGERIVRVRDVTSSWLAVAYPVAPGLPRTHLELVAHLLHEALDPTPPLPDRYDVDVRIEETPGGPVLLVEASVYPEAAAVWEARILEAAEVLGRDPLADDFFRWRRRRFRTTRLLEEAAPEAEARRVVGDLLRDGRKRDLATEIWRLDADALQAAARSLGAPRILLMGPDLGADASSNR